MDPGRSGSDKEIQAMTSNQKEARTLLKRLSTIGMEEHYSIKLLDVTHRQIKNNQNRLKSRVNKITSKLAAVQISEFKTQEQEGRFKPEYNPIAASGAIRIAAASKRLKLQSERERIESARNSTRWLPKRCAPQEGKNSTKQFQPVTPRRPKSARAACLTDTVSEMPELDTAPEEKEDDGAWATKVRRIPEVRHASCTTKRTTKPGGKPSLRPKTAPTPGFSSHITHESERARRPSTVSVESVSFDSSKDRNEETRREMLELEQMNNIRLQTRSKTFIDSTVRWIKDNSARVSNNLDLVDQMIRHVSGTPTGQRLLNRSPSIATHKSYVKHSPAEVKAQQVKNVWKDLKKCRYLRLEDDQIDISGVNTLVRNQMKQFGSLNNKPRTAFSNVTLYSPEDKYRRRQSIMPGAASPAESAAALASVIARVASAQSE